MRQARVGVDIGDEAAGGGEEAGLARVGKAFARFVDDAYAGVAQGDFTRVVGAGVVDDDDLDVIPSGGFFEDGLEAIRQIPFFVVSRDDEA